MWLRGCAFVSVLLLAACESGDIRKQLVDWPPDSSRSQDADDDDAGYPRLDAARRFDASTPLDAAIRDAGPRDAAPLDAAAMDATNPTLPDAAPPRKPAVVFDPPGRGFTDAIMLTLSAGEAGAKVHFTVDGSLPTASSPEVAGPIALTQTTLVRAIAVRDGISTPVFDQSYFQLDPDVQSFTSNLPIVIVHMLGGTAPQPSNRSYVG